MIQKKVVLHHQCNEKSLFSFTKEDKGNTTKWKSHDFIFLGSWTYNSWKILPHPSYSSDLTPSDFFLCLHLKNSKEAVSMITRTPLKMYSWRLIKEPIVCPFTLRTFEGWRKMTETGTMKRNKKKVCAKLHLSLLLHIKAKDFLNSPLGLCWDS